MSQPKSHVVPMSTMKFSFDKENAPALTVRSGDELTFFTEDANCAYITKETDIVTDFDKMYSDCGGCNPVSGPVYIAEAKKGDYIAVDILEVKAGEEYNGGYTSVYSGFGGLHALTSFQEPYESRTKICKYENGQGLFKTNDGKKIIRFDLNPFIGTIGVAPKEDRRSSFYHGQDFAGNMDCPDICAGSTVVLPCNVDGALLALGDVHGAQGDGEITACALECRGEVRVRVRVLSAQQAMYCDWPQVNTEDYIGAVICNSAMNLGDQIRIGYVELINRMSKYYGFDKVDAYQLLNLAAKVRIGQACFTQNSCVVKLPRKYLD